jgi:hypothetical protein
MSAVSSRPITPRQLNFRQFLWLWNRLQRQRTPSLHLEIAAWLDRCWETGERRLLLLSFRSAGKSTLLGAFCAWLLLRNPDLRILVLSAEYDLAKKMVRNVKTIVKPTIIPHTLCDPSGSNMPGTRSMDGGLLLTAAPLGTASTS